MASDASRLSLNRTNPKTRDSKIKFSVQGLCGGFKLNLTHWRKPISDRDFSSNIWITLCLPPVFLSLGMYASPISPYRSNFLLNVSVEVLFWIENQSGFYERSYDGTVVFFKSIPIRKIVDLEGDHSVDIGWSTWHNEDSIKQVIMHRLDTRDQPGYIM